MSMSSVFTVSLVLNLIDNMTRGAEQSGRALQDAFSGTAGAFDMTQKAGLAMAGAGTAVTGACMSAVTATFDTQNALGELASLGVEDLAAVEAAAKSFSDTWAGTSKADFITASYDIKSGIASLSDEGVAQFTELAALTGKATKSTTETMGSLFATGYGIYKGYYDDMSDLEFGEMFSAGIATAVKNYKTSGNQMADAIGRLGATATNANVPMEEQLAILGQLQTTMSGSEAATKYNAFLQAAAGAGEALGLTFVDANNQLMSTPEILETLRGKYGDTLDAMEKQELKEAFGTDEAIKFIDLLYQDTDHLKSGIEDLQQSMQGGVAVTEDMAAAINNTPSQKFDVIKQKVHNMAESFGSTLLPIVNSTLDSVAGLVQKGSDWIANNEETVASVMQVVLGLGIFLVAAGALVSVVGTAGKVISGASGAFKVLQTVMGSGGILSALGPIGAVAAAVAALIGLFEACGGDVSQLSGIFGSVFGAVSGIIGQALSAVAAYLPGFLEFGIALLQNILTGIAEGLPGLMTSGAAMVVNVLGGIVEALPGMVSAGIQLLLSLLSGIAQYLPTLLSAGIQMISTILSGLIQMLPNLISGGLSIIGSIISGLIQGIPMLLGMAGELVSTIGRTILETDWLAVGGQMVSGIKDGFMSGFKSLVDSVKGAWGKFTDWLSGGGSDEEIEITDTSSPVEASVPDVPAGEPETPQVPVLTGGSITLTPEVEIDTSQYEFDMDGLLSSMQTDISLEPAGAAAAESFGSGLLSGIPESAAGLDTAIEDIMGSVGTADTGTVDTLGSDIMSSLTGSLSAMSPEVSAQMEACWDSASSVTESGMARMNSAVSSGMQRAKDTVSGAASSMASDIRSAFANLQVTVPAPKLPHVSVAYNTVGSGQATAKVPDFTVSYYAAGGIMTDPAMFAYDPGSNRGMVGGEAGAEAILPLDPFWVKLDDAVSQGVRYNMDVKAGKLQAGAAARVRQPAGARQPGSTGKNIHIDKVEYKINVNMDDIDSVIKLKQLLDEIDVPEQDEGIA